LADKRKGKEEAGRGLNASKGPVDLMDWIVTDRDDVGCWYSCASIETIRFEDSNEGEALGRETRPGGGGEGITLGHASLSALDEREDIGVSILVKLKLASTIVGEVDGHG